MRRSATPELAGFVIDFLLLACYFEMFLRIATYVSIEQMLSLFTQGIISLHCNV
jgi:hypothetical protein